MDWEEVKLKFSSKYDLWKRLSIDRGIDLLQIDFS